MTQVDLTPRTVQSPSNKVHAAVSWPSRQEISLQVLDTDRHHCQNRASVGMTIPISRPVPVSGTVRQLRRSVRSAGGMDGSADKDQHRGHGRRDGRGASPKGFRLAVDVCERFSRRGRDTCQIHIRGLKSHGSRKRRHPDRRRRVTIGNRLPGKASQSRRQSTIRIRKRYRTCSSGWPSFLPW